MLRTIESAKLSLTANLIFGFNFAKAYKLICVVVECVRAEVDGKPVLQAMVLAASDAMNQVLATLQKALVTSNVPHLSQMETFQGQQPFPISDHHSGTLENNSHSSVPNAVPDWPIQNSLPHSSLSIHQDDWVGHLFLNTPSDRLIVC